MKSIGINIGSGSISIAVICDNTLEYSDYRLHKGNIPDTLNSMLTKVSELYKEGDIDYSAINDTARYFYSTPDNILPDNVVVNRITAITNGTRLLYGNVGSIMEIGSKTSCYINGISDTSGVHYTFNRECAAGTGSFFEDQMYRLSLSLESYSEYTRRAKSIPRLAGRCSVFAKTDLIHRQQEGVPPEDILLGLAYAVIRNYKASVVRKSEVASPVVLSGGVVYNEGVRRAVKDIFNLNDEELICDNNGAIASAVGIAVTALKHKLQLDYMHPIYNHSQNNSASKPLIPISYDKDSLHKTRPLNPGENVWLGIDVGSTSTNLVIIGDDKEVIDYLYLRTGGRPIKTVQEGLSILKDKYKEDLHISGSCVTGSGRYLIAKELNSDSVIDEITAQARASAWLFKDVDTVFEIGGQDSKYISVKNGQVIDFEMNKVCAAGTGSFIEEQASRLNISLSDIGPSAIDAKTPVDLGERCTVLMESKVSDELAKDTDKRDICAGLCRSIVKNYLNRVVVNKKIGNVICLQGGIIHNEGIVSAFYEQFGERIHITPYYDVTGAYGAAIEACTNNIQISDNDIQTNENIYNANNQWFLAGYTGIIDPSKKTVGIPRALMIYKFFPMAYHYFNTLGYNVLLTPESNEDIIALAQEVTEEETCYPVKLLHGHMEYLARQGVDYIFIPCIRTILHAKSSVKHNYGCVYMQTAPKIVAKTLHLKERGITLLSPVLDLDMGRPELASEMLAIGQKLGKSKPVCAAGMAKGAMAMARCEKESEKLGKQVMDSLSCDDKVLVIITRNYGVSDRILNSGIPQELLKRGCKVLTLSHLKGHDIDLSAEYPNMYWPFGQHILSGARIIKNHPNLYAVYLTNHGCGPDTMISHLFAEEMGDKPYLSIEVDEHQSAVGIITRIEAFLNSLKYTNNTSNNSHNNNINHNNTNNIINVINNSDNHNCINNYDDSLVRYILPFGIYSHLYSNYCKDMMSPVHELDDYNKSDLDCGRKNSITKEYCTYTAITGKTYNLAKKCLEEKRNSTIMIPQTEGSEIDGVASRVINSALTSDNITNINIISPFVENLLDTSDSYILWQLIILGDALNLLHPSKREQYILSLSEYNKLNWNDTKIILRHIHDDILSEPRENILLCGSPILLNSNYLNRNLINTIYDKGYLPVTMSFAEYLWFFICESGRTPDTVYTDMIDEFFDIYSDIYGYHNNINARLNQVNDNFFAIAGANTRYLAWLCSSEHSTCKAVILVTPEYANYASVTELMRNTPDKPFLHYQLDGNEEYNEIEKREIFLDMLKNRS